MKIISCTFDHAPQILDIFNDAILHTTALYDYQPWTMETMQQWFATKAAGNYPIIGIVDESGRLAGFGSYGAFRIRPAYKYTIEHSLYVHKDFRGKGIGKIILAEIIRNAQEQQYHCMVGVIDASNAASIHLHNSMGFTLSGRIHQAGFKFGKWLDTDFYQLLLNTPEHPIDG